MKRNEVRSSTGASSTAGQSHAPTFAKVLDGRKQPIRALWERNGRYYAQLKIENPITGIKKTKRVPLKDGEGNPVATVAQAVAQLARLQTQRSDNALPVLSRQPKFADYAKRYLESISAGQGAKKPGTREKEKAILGRWTEAVGHLRLDQIKRVHVNRFIDNRLKEVDKSGQPRAGARTINLDVITLRVVMKRALSDGLIQRLPTEGLRPLKSTAPRRSLVTVADIDKLCASAVGATKNAQEFADYIRLMAYCGARRNEALGIQWEDVDFDNGQLHIRRQITHRGIESLKNGEERTVDFNAKLRAHLEDMQSRNGDASDWLFPSPQRGDKDIPAKSFQESLCLARDKAGMQGFGFHDLRHHFVSLCVMSGIDFMTIAAWVGHRDGGILIGRVYGHLANEHRKSMAERVNFEPTVVATAAA